MCISIGEKVKKEAELRRMATNPSSRSHAISSETESTVSLGEPLIAHETQLHSPNGSGASFLRTCFNGLNALSGMGLISMPYALSEGGWLSLLPALVVAIICFYTGLLIHRCMNVDRRIKSYPDIGEVAFGYKGRAAVSTFMCLELYLAAVGLLILEGDNLDKLFPDSSLKVGTLSLAGKQCFVVLVALIILPTTWLKNLGVLAYVSAGGVLASVFVVMTVFWVATMDGVGFHERGRLLNLQGLPTALGLYTFCYCGHGVFPTLHTSMKDSSKFSKVLLFCFILCTLNYGSMAVFGYLMYGEGTKSQLTLNLPIGKISSKIAICTTLINPLTKYALMVTPVANAIEEKLMFHYKISAAILIRTLLVFSTVIIALVIPFFAYLTALIGSTLGILVSILLPCICYIKIYNALQDHKFELAIIVGILIIGFLIAIMGTYSSIQQIVSEL